MKSMFSQKYTIFKKSCSNKIIKFLTKSGKSIYIKQRSGAVYGGSFPAIWSIKHWTALKGEGGGSWIPWRSLSRSLPQWLVPVLKSKAA